MKDSCMMKYFMNMIFKKSFKLQSQDVQINPIQAMDTSLIVSKSSWIELENNNALNKSVNETQLQQHECLVTKSTTLEANLSTNVKALDVGLVVTERSRTNSDKQDISSRSGKDADIKGEIDQNAKKYQITSPLLDSLTQPNTSEQSYQSLKSKNISFKKTVTQFQKDFSRMEAHCVNMELKYQNQALDGQHGQILNKTSDKANIKKEIDVLETINIELESRVAKLLTENEKLNKENEHLKHTYKELYDSIKKTRIQMNDHNDSLIAQVNSKTYENADLKAQIQEKVFANAAVKNELRKLKGTSVDTKFAKPSILGKLVLQTHRHQSLLDKRLRLSLNDLNFQNLGLPPKLM
nr:hypothetical protein [Tanacetum cinerariifolium]